MEAVGFGALTRMLRRRWPVMLALLLLSGGLTVAFIMTRKATYIAVAQLMVTPHESPQQRDPSGSTATDSEIEVLRSPALMNDVAEALGLRSTATDNDGASAMIGRAVAIRRRPETSIIEISASGRTGRFAQQLANTYADVYIANQLRARVDTSQQANSWVARRLAELRDDVEAKENAAEAFRVQAGLPTEGEPQSPALQADLQSQMQIAQADLQDRQSRSHRLQELINSSAPIESIASVVNSDTLNGLRDRMADIDRRQADLENRYLPSHPAVIAVRAERETVNEQVQREVQRAAADLVRQVSAARARVAALQQSARATPVHSSDNDAAAAHLRELRQAATNARQTYDAFLQRNQDMADARNLSTPDSRILTYAGLPPSPAWPRWDLALALAMTIGLLLAFGYAVATEIVDQSVKNADDLEQKVGCAAVASIPTISARMMRQMPPAERHPAGYLVGRPMSAFAEALRVLRTVIVYSKLETPTKVIAVTSALPGEGKTTISMCLARVAAMSGQRVCVVDCDLRMQSINDVIDIESDVGILQVLAGETPWRSAIVRDPNSDAHILPVATSGFTPRDVFGSEAMARLIGELRSHYDMVILDCAPILAVAETRILVKQADTTILVARSGKTPVGALRAAVSQTRMAGGKVLGVALNYVLPHWQTYSDSIYFNQSKSYYSVG